MLVQFFLCLYYVLLLLLLLLLAAIATFSMYCLFAVGRIQFVYSRYVSSYTNNREYVLSSSANVRVSVYLCACACVQVSFVAYRQANQSNVHIKSSFLRQLIPSDSYYLYICIIMMLFCIETDNLKLIFNMTTTIFSSFFTSTHNKIHSVYFILASLL